MLYVRRRAARGQPEEHEPAQHPGRVLARVRRGLGHGLCKRSHRRASRRQIFGGVVELGRGQVLDMFSEFLSIFGRPRCRHQIRLVAQYNLDRFLAPSLDFVAMAIRT